MSRGIASAALAVCWCAGTNVAWAQEDPGAAGPHSVSPPTEYNLGPVDLDCDASGQNCLLPGSELRAQVYYPADIANGPYPLVLFLHGRHPTCYDTNTGDGTYAWPCPGGQAEIPSYKGYDYLASLLASHGMVVASISANAVNAGDNATGDGGTTARADLIRHHLDSWNTFVTTGGAPFGTAFVGRVDLQKVGTMGHSRGGEAIAAHYLSNIGEGSPYGIRAVMPIAPTHIYVGAGVSNVPLAILLGYCDGDLEQLPGVRRFDGARYNATGDVAPKYTILGLGANHNYFNRYWTPDQFPNGSEDDWSSLDADPTQTDPHCGTNATTNSRLSSAEQRNFGSAYAAAFFRRHLLGQQHFDPVLLGESFPSSAQTTDVSFAYLAGANDRMDLNQITASSALPGPTLPGKNNLNGDVTATGLTAAFCDSNSSCTSGAYRRAHFGSLGTAKLSWASPGGIFSNALPTFRRDVSNFSVFQFRAAVNYTDLANAFGQPQDLRVRFVDAHGGTSIVRVSDYSGALRYPPGSNPTGSRDFRAAVMNGVRLPMNALLDVDLTNLSSVDFMFDQSSSGALLVSDLGFAGDGMSIAEEMLIMAGMI